MLSDLLSKLRLKKKKHGFLLCLTQSYYTFCILYPYHIARYNCNRRRSRFFEKVIMRLSKTAVFLCVSEKEEVELLMQTTKNEIGIK